jgi:hypothetical protein
LHGKSAIRSVLAVEARHLRLDMDFPPEWVVLQMEEFNTATPDYQGDFTIELLAQLRSMGRILDNFRFALDGTLPLDATVDLASIILVEAYQGWKLNQQFWPRDVLLRKNMVTSAWTSVTDTVASQDCDITYGDGAGISAGEFIRSIDTLPGTGPTNWSTRWAVVIGGDLHLKLQWQALPLPASILNGKASFKRNHKTKTNQSGPA